MAISVAQQRHRECGFFPIDRKAMDQRPSPVSLRHPGLELDFVAAGGGETVAGVFDLIMTDCNMPGMNGYQLAQAIRATPDKTEAQQHCVIWGYTANAQPQEIQRCKEAGMDDCLFKPIGLEDLQKRLATGLPYAAASATPELSDALFDASALETMTRGNFTLMSKLANELIKSNRSDSQLLAQHVAGADWLAASDIAHSIKGASMIVGAQVLSEAAAELESLCRDGAADADLHQAAYLVQAEITRLETSLENWLAAAAPGA